MTGPLLPILTAGVAALALGCGGSGTRAPRVDDLAVAPGPPVELTLETLEGEPFTLASLRGRAVLVNLFATWCEACARDLALLGGIAEDEIEIPGVEVVAISVDTEPQKVLPPYLELIEPSFPVLLADEAMLLGRSPFGGIRAVPVTFLLDVDGRHVETFTGVIPIDYLRRRVRAMTEGEQ